MSSGRSSRDEAKMAQQHLTESQTACRQDVLEAKCRKYPTPNNNNNNKKCSQCA